MSEFKHPEAQKEFVIKRREMFFKEIEAKLSIPPGAIDAVMGQNQHYIKPDKAKINTPEMGNLLIEVKAGEHSILYSIYQIGKSLRIGVLMEAGIFQYDLKNEFSAMWRGDMVISLRGENTMMEWVFDEPDLLNSWSTQEEYVLGIRHMHFRLLTSLKEAGVI